MQGYTSEIVGMVEELEIAYIQMHLDNGAVCGVQIKPPLSHVPDIPPCDRWIRLTVYEGGDRDTGPTTTPARLNRAIESQFQEGERASEVKIAVADLFVPNI